jgi:UDP-N-acetylmuramoyl-tripeptide--D-alanyl-D-alanine ligase
MTIEPLYQIYLNHPVVGTDTRKIVPGSIFFALKGDKFDANMFASQALKAGAAYAVIDDAQYQQNDRYILVQDVLTTLQQLAGYHRKKLKIPLIGLTGSNGKTTTKELIKAVLSQRFKTYATIGNLNNHIGVPLTILAIDNSIEVAVVEMGANHQKEIELLCSIAQPSEGLITNVGKAHLEGFGGPEGVKKGKGELYDYLKANNGTVFVNSDSVVLEGMIAERSIGNVIRYGADETNTVSGKLLENSPFLKLCWKVKNGEFEKVQTQLTGAYNMDNVLAAICIAHYFKLTASEINMGINGYQPQNNRSQIIKTASNTLICDYYNANPSSMFVAIENIHQLPNGPKVVILGDMFELGNQAEYEHKGVIQKAIITPLNERVFIGAEFYKQKGLVEATFYKTVEDAITAFKQTPLKGYTILIKGSRGMALEKLLELF